MPYFSYINAHAIFFLQFWYQLEHDVMRKIDIVIISVSAVGVVLNIVVILAIVIDPLKVLRKGPWITIFSLATADLITCISAFCNWGWEHLIPEFNELYFSIVDFFWLFGSSGSFLMLTFLTVQIYIITKYPMKSRYWLTTKRILSFGIGHWLVAILLGFSNIAWLRFHYKKTMKIFIAQIAILEFATVIQVILNIRVAIEIIRSGRIAGNARQTKHKKIAKTVIILTLILFFTAFPYFLFKQLELLARSEYFGQSETGQKLFAISYCYTPIAILNFVANPVLYSLRLPDYRNSFLAFVGKKRDLGSSQRTIRSTSTAFTNTFAMRSQKGSESSNGNCKQ